MPNVIGALAIQFTRRLQRLAREVSAYGDMRLIAPSGLFEASFYELGRQGDPGLHPLAHFCIKGAALGFRPNLYFDPLWYARTYLGPSAARMNPLSHYIRRGEEIGLHPTPSFDPHWYASRYGLTKGASPLAHFLAHRRGQRFSPNADFDIDFYMARYGEEIGPNRDPYAHFLRHGAVRDLSPSPDFVPMGHRGHATFGDDPPAGSDVSPWTAQEDRIPLVHQLRRLAEAAAAGVGGGSYRPGAANEARTHAL